MPKKQTKPKYPKDVYMLLSPDGCEYLNKNIFDLMLDRGDDEAEVAIYKFDRLAKVKRTVTVE